MLFIETIFFREYPHLRDNFIFSRSSSQIHFSILFFMVLFLKNSAFTWTWFIWDTTMWVFCDRNIRELSWILFFLTGFLLIFSTRLWEICCSWEPFVIIMLVPQTGSGSGFEPGESWKLGGKKRQFAWSSNYLLPFIHEEVRLKPRLF